MIFNSLKIRRFTKKVQINIDFFLCEGLLYPILKFQNTTEYWRTSNDKAIAEYKARKSRRIS